MFKGIFGGGEGKPNNQVNQSVIVSSSKEQKEVKKRSVKEDPGPQKGMMSLHKRPIVKTVNENKKKIDAKNANWSKAEDTIEKWENLNKAMTQFFELPISEILNNLQKNENYEIIKQTIEYFHKNGSMMQKLENQEKALLFPIKTDSVLEESDLVKHLREANECQANEITKLNEQIKVITKDRNKISEELAKNKAELDAKSKNIAELNYTVRCSNNKIQEYYKQMQQLTKSLEELKRMYNQDQLSGIKSIANLKTEKQKLQTELDEEREKVKKLVKDNEELSHENAARSEENRSSKPANKSMSKAFEPAAPSVTKEDTINFHTVLKKNLVFFNYKKIK